MSDDFVTLSPERVSTILDSINEGVFTIDEKWRITSFNRAAERITGVPREEVLGRRCSDVFRASICESSCALRHTIETGDAVVNKNIYIVSAKGERIPISISTALLRDDKGRVLGGVETFRDLTLVEELRKELAGRYSFADIISKSSRMRKIFDILPEVARSTCTVLIEGESGTGKELVARALHNLSSRKDKPFVAVNCGALPDELLESELFGYKAGAFTDAKKDKLGRFALAEAGTLFLDEIGDVSPALQVRLLRVLQEKTYEPLGATETVRTDVRVVTATNKPLAELVLKGSFREDLYYRVNVVRLTLPPLSERKEDIPLLVDHFVNRFNRLQDKDITGVSGTSMAILTRHNYPGNIRELENIVERAFVLCQKGLIEPWHLPEELVPHTTEEIPGAGVGTRRLRLLERQLIIETLKQNGWNRSAAARELGVHKTTLFRKIKALGIQLPQRDGRHSRK